MTSRIAQPRQRKEPLTVARILDTAFALIAAEGFEALTMRRVAAALDTGAASLYAHVRNKAELDDLLIGALCADVRIPGSGTPNERFTGICAQLRDRFLRYPGVSRAALSASPTTLDAMRISEALLGALLDDGAPARDAAWAVDAALLYVAAYSLEASLRAASGMTDPAERLRALPAVEFPHTLANAEAMTSGVGHERFDFTLRLLLGGIMRLSDQRETATSG